MLKTKADYIALALILVWVLFLLLLGWYWKYKVCIPFETTRQKQNKVKKVSEKRKRISK